MNSKILSIIFNIFFISNCFAMEKESIYDEWQIVDNSSLPLTSVGNNPEDFELKAKALGNTVVTILEGTGMALYNFGIHLIESKIQQSINQFDRGLQTGSFVVGSLYGQGVALDAAYENEKATLKSKNEEK